MQRTSPSPSRSPRPRNLSLAESKARLSEATAQLEEVKTSPSHLSLAAQARQQRQLLAQKLEAKQQVLNQQVSLFKGLVKRDKQITGERMAAQDFVITSQFASASYPEGVFNSLPKEKQVELAARWQASHEGPKAEQALRERFAVGAFRNQRDQGHSMEILDQRLESSERMKALSERETARLVLQKKDALVKAQRDQQFIQDTMSALRRHRIGESSGDPSPTPSAHHGSSSPRPLSPSAVSLGLPSHPPAPPVGSSALASASSSVAQLLQFGLPSSGSGPSSSLLPSPPPKPSQVVAASSTSTASTRRPHLPGSLLGTTPSTSLHLPSSSPTHHGPSASLVASSPFTPSPSDADPFASGVGIGAPKSGPLVLSHSLSPDGRGHLPLRSGGEGAASSSARVLHQSRSKHRHHHDAPPATDLSPTEAGRSRSDSLSSRSTSESSHHSASPSQQGSHRSSVGSVEETAVGGSPQKRQASPHARSTTPPRPLSATPSSLPRIGASLMSPSAAQGESGPQDHRYDLLNEVAPGVSTEGQQLPHLASSLSLVDPSAAASSLATAASGHEQQHASPPPLPVPSPSRPLSRRPSLSGTPSATPGVLPQVTPLVTATPALPTASPLPLVDLSTAASTLATVASGDGLRVSPPPQPLPRLVTLMTAATPGNASSTASPSLVVDPLRRPQSPPHSPKAVVITASLATAASGDGLQPPHPASPLHPPASLTPPQQGDGNDPLS